MARPALRWEYDVCLYHMGNQALYHEHIYRALVRYPGVVVMHEFNLFGFYLHRPEPYGGPAAFVREMGYAYGIEGTQLARAILDGRAERNPAHYPLCKRIADVSYGMIVHTAFARERILLESPQTRVTHIPLAAYPPVSQTIGPRPALLDQFPQNTIILGSFGYIAPSKRLEVALHALEQLRQRYPTLRYVLVGQQVEGYDLAPLIEQLGLTDVVHLIGYSDGPTFQAYLNAIDIGINLRTGPSGGEMSASAVRLLAAGKPTLVSNVAGFADLPDECVVKIEQDEREVDRIVDALHQLIDDPRVRAAYGLAAQQYVEHESLFPALQHSMLRSFKSACSDEQTSDWHSL